jgi:pimeloyl-ACP methyl ester carboxylesterase
MGSTERTVVVVSGGDAVSPFTTPTLACGRGMAAGNTDTALREVLLAAGRAVYTAPAMNARTVVQDPDPDSFGAFGEQPVVLPAHMTMISNGDIDNAGEHLARFAQHLYEEYDVRRIDWVTHSNGGLFARSATRILGEIGHPLQVTSLTTLGTPWMGGVPNRIVYGELPESVCLGDPAALKMVEMLRIEAETELGLGPQDTYRYLMGETGWNQAQAGVLDGIPVFLVGGTGLTVEGGDPELWPNDGLVSEYSAFASDVGTDVLPLRRTASYPLVHSIFIADMLGLDWQQGLTWNTQVLADVEAFLQSV